MWCRSGSPHGGRRGGATRVVLPEAGELGGHVPEGSLTDDERNVAVDEDMSDGVADACPAGFEAQLPEGGSGNRIEAAPGDRPRHPVEGRGSITTSDCFCST